MHFINLQLYLNDLQYTVEQVVNFNLCVFRVCERRKRDNSSSVVTETDHFFTIHKLQVPDRNTTQHCLEPLSVHLYR